MQVLARAGWLVQALSLVAQLPGPLVVETAAAGIEAGLVVFEPLVAVASGDPGDPGQAVPIPVASVAGAAYTLDLHDL